MASGFSAPVAVFGYYYGNVGARGRLLIEGEVKRREGAKRSESGIVTLQINGKWQGFMKSIGENSPNPMPCRGPAVLLCERSRGRHLNSSGDPNSCSQATPCLESD